MLSSISLSIEKKVTIFLLCYRVSIFCQLYENYLNKNLRSVCTAHELNPFQF